jgi:hypothetical protein
MVYGSAEKEQARTVGESLRRCKKTDEFFEEMCHTHSMNTLATTLRERWQQNLIGDAELIAGSSEGDDRTVIRRSRPKPGAISIRKRFS